MLTTLLAALAVQTPGLPADLVGEWRYTSIRGTTYWDSSSGAYLGHGGGSSDTYIFAKDGSYKEYVYIQNSPSAGWTTKIFTTIEGRVEVEGGRMKLVVTKGRYKTEDNRVARYNIDRPMTAEEAKKLTKESRFSLASENGKPLLVFDLGKEKMKYQKVR